MTDPTPAPDWRALCKELRDALENAFQVMAGEGGTQHISTATDVLLRADAHLATPPDRLRQCPTHGQQSENAWGCPECVRELREELARVSARAVWDRAVIDRLAQGAAVQPVPVSERPWERPGWLNKNGLCWFGSARECAIHAAWSMRRPIQRISHQRWCAPWWALPVPAAEKGEVAA
jgi:hypothetical protein